LKSIPATNFYIFSKSRALASTTQPAIADATSQLRRSEADFDLGVFNAKVYTVDPFEPTTQAFAVKAGIFVAVGERHVIPATFSASEGNLLISDLSDKTRVLAPLIGSRDGLFDAPLLP
jgi:hypothetical protein